MDSEQTVRQRGENEFPTGNITYKTIKGRKYAYYQWSEGGKQRSRRVRDEEIAELSEKFVKHPSDFVSVGDIVNVKVLSVDVKKKRIALSMKGLNK